MPAFRARNAHPPGKRCQLDGSASREPGRRAATTTPYARPYSWNPRWPRRRANIEIGVADRFDLEAESGEGKCVARRQRAREIFLDAAEAPPVLNRTSSVGASTMIPALSLCCAASRGCAMRQPPCPSGARRRKRS